MTSFDLSGSNVSSEWVVLNTKYQKRVEYDEMGIPFYEMVFIYRNISSDFVVISHSHAYKIHPRNLRQMWLLANNPKSSTNAFILYLDNDSPHLAYVFVINFRFLYANRWLRKNHFINLHSHWSNCFLDTACKTSTRNFYWRSTIRTGIH